MDALFGIGGIVGLLLLTGCALGFADRSRFSLGWFLAAAGLVLLNDFLLTNGYGLLPDLIPGATWNWQGKVLALLATLAVVALPIFGWRRVGLTLDQASGSLKSSLPITLIYAAFFAFIALLSTDEAATGETIAFQLTMPGLEEEIFYRGLLLLALDRAFTARVRFLGVDWGWGAVLSCALFGLAHAFGFKDGQYSFDAIVMALTAIPSFLAVWMRLRTGSLLLPILLHNVGNSASFIV